MFKTLRDAWSIEDLRRKIIYTVFIILVFRLGSAIPLPFIDTNVLKQFFDSSDVAGTALQFMNLYSGGGLGNATLLSMGVSPYINASIILQLLTVAIPALERMVKDGGEEGRKKMASWTRYIAIVLGLLQGLSYYVILTSRHLIAEPNVIKALTIVLVLSAGTAIVMWLGEHINEKGIGNGISIILFAGIISRGPSMVTMLVQLCMSGVRGIIETIALIVVGVLLIMFIVFMYDAERRIPVQYAKRVVGRKMYGGQSTHLPIKVNAAGVMPVIFAGSILSIPQTITMFWKPAEGSVGASIIGLFKQTNPFYIVLYALLIVGFAYFYASIQFNPIEIANNMKKNGGFIPGFRPGKPTAEFIAKALGKVTFIGSLFLGVIAILPLIVGAFSANLSNVAIGGTSVIIVVGVALDTVKQLEAQMMMRHHKGFLE